MSAISYEDLSALEIVTDGIRRKILNKSWPSDLEQEITKSCTDLFGNRYMCVSVRSSATAEDLPNASFAGQQDTFLFVNGIANVLDSIKKCFASLYTTRAVLYREKNDISEQDLYMAVVVQDMIDPEYAGVGFSVDPISRSEDIVLIETAPGVGEHVVSGSLTPDTYLHNIKTNIIEKRLSGKKQIMKDGQIRKLSKLIKKIEFHYKYPQDIEWAVDKAGKIWILQSRPITTL